MSLSSQNETLPSVAIIVPFFSGIEQLTRCINSILASSYANFNIVLVDHSASEELTGAPYLEDGRVKLLRESPSNWWAGATNRGLEYAIAQQYPMIMLINHDCFVRNNTVQLLVEACNENDHAIITPVQHHLYSGRNIGRVSTCFLLGFSTLILPDWFYIFSKKESLMTTSMILGGRGVIADAAAFRKIGLLDEEKFPHYGADHDFYFRARRQGYRLLVHNEALVDIDSTKTTAAGGKQGHTIQSFYRSLIDRRSHRNLKDLYTLFSKYYPIPGLAALGVALNIARYVLVILFGALHRLFSLRSRASS